MRKRYLPFGYQIKHGEIAIALKESNAVRFIFEEYLAGKSLKEIADIMSAKDIPYHEGTQKWNQNMVGRILASKIYYDNENIRRLFQKLNTIWLRSADVKNIRHTPQYYNRFAKICNADVVTNVYTGIRKQINGFAEGVECGRSHCGQRKLPPPSRKNCAGSGRTQKSSTPPKDRQMCNP